MTTEDFTPSPPRRRSSGSTRRPRRSSSSASRPRTTYIDEGSEDENDDAHIPLAPPSYEEDAEEHASLLAARQSGEHSLGGWHYAPLVVGLAPPLAAILGGGKADHWSDAILLLLSGFWLFQCLKVPHDIYYAARTRRILEQHQQEEELEGEEDPRTAHRRHLAIVELQRTEVIALLACIASPVVGAYLLQWLQANLHDGSRYLNQFNIRLFMMAAGIRPWIHTFKLIRRRCLLLQEDVHYPSAKVESLSRRLKRIEADLSSLRKSTVSHTDVRTLRDGIDVPLSNISRNLKRYEKRSELNRSNSEDKFTLVEARLEDLLRECAINAELIETERIERERSSSLARNVLEAFKFAIGQRNTPPSAWQARQAGIADSTPRMMLGQGGAQGTSRPHSTQVAPPPREWYSQGLAYWAFLPLNLTNSLLRYAGGDGNLPNRKLIANGTTTVTSPPTSPPTSPKYQHPYGPSIHITPAGASNGQHRAAPPPQLPPLQPTNLNINPLGANANAQPTSPSWKRVQRGK